MFRFILNHHQFGREYKKIYFQETLLILEFHRYTNSEHNLSYFYDTVGLQNNSNQRLHQIKEHFTVLQKNKNILLAHHTYEGLMITSQNRDLNKQVFHKSMTFVYDCATKLKML